MKQITTAIVLSLVAFFSSKAQVIVINACESNPCNAFVHCGAGNVIQQNSFASIGNPQGTCGANFFTGNWVYYRFTCYASGNLNFTITPNDAASDINWALWNITTTGCANLSSTTTCNAAPSAGAVNSGIIPITGGNTYILGIQRASGGTTTLGFSINFTGTTATLFTTTPTALESVLPFDNCLPVNQVKVKLTQPVRCSQTSVNDFNISSNPTFTVGGTSCPGCINTTAPLVNYSTYEDTLVFNFPTALAPGTYTISFNPASSNPPRNSCNILPNTIPTVSFTVPIPGVSNTTTVSVCDSYTWLVNNQTYTQSGTYSSVSNCDTEILQLTIIPSTQIVQNEMACASYTWSENGTTYTQSGTYTSVNGCATNILNLTINPLPLVTAPDVSSCTGTVLLEGTPSGGSWNLPNPYSGNATSYSYTYTDQNGCIGSASGNISSNTPLITNLQVGNITGVSALVMWNSSALWYEIRHKPINASSWSPTVTSNTTNKPLNGLNPGTVYSVEVRGFCNASTLGPWVGNSFTTNMSCGVPSGLSISAISATTSKLNWLPVSSANYYTVRWKKTNTSSWISGTTLSNSKVVASLTPNSNYEFQVSTNCGSAGGSVNTAWSYLEPWSTLNGKSAANEEEFFENDIQLYPNPTHGDLTVALSVEKNTMLALRLEDMSGRVVQQTQAEVMQGNNTITLKLAGLNQGIYILYILNNNELVKVNRITKN